jgi:hypothetical protein
MTEQEWLACADARTLLMHLQRRKRTPSARKLRLFACACAGAISPIIANDYPGEYRDLLHKGAQELIEWGERLADGEMHPDEVEHHCQAYLLRISVQCQGSISPRHWLSHFPMPWTLRDGQPMMRRWPLQIHGADEVWRR